MKNGRKPNDVERLLDAVLVDAQWQTLDRTLQTEALAVLGLARRRRRWRVAMAQVTPLAVLLLAAVWWLHSPDQGRGPITSGSAQSVGSDAEEVFVSEDKMLAMFPPGSCAVAEVNGKKELIFFDVKKAHEGFVIDNR